MELELKHIACYLPYYLEAISPELEIKTVDWKTQTYGTEKVGLNFLFSEYENTLYKPLLRPLEHLTKEIEHNGEKFVPIDRLSSEFSIRLGGTLQEMNVISIGGMELEDLELLLSLHFDIYRLIPKGLALPKP